MDTINVLFLCGCAVCLIVCGNGMRKMFGPVQNRSFHTFRSGWAANSGVLGELVLTLAYPFWWLAYLLFGDPPELPRKIETPKGPLEDDEGEPPDIEAVLNKVRIAFTVKYDIKNDATLNAVLATCRRILEKDYSQKGTDFWTKEKNGLARLISLHTRLFESFDEFLEKVIILQPGSLTVTLSQLASPRLIDSLFQAISKNNVFPDTYSAYAHFRPS